MNLRNLKMTFTSANSLSAKKGVLSVLCLLLPACASTYNIQSSPPGANVYYVEPGSQKKIFLGTTPLSYSKSNLPTQQAFMMYVGKDGFKGQDIPMAATDESKTVVNVRLKPEDEILNRNSKELNDLLKKFFRAQQMIYERQFHSAIIELDKLIKERPDLVQAYVMKGTSYFLLNEMNSAVASWKIALKLDPENPELLKFLQDKKVNIRDVEAAR